MEIETDKATLDVPSPVAGRIESIEVKEGDKLSIGQVIAVIEETDKGDPSESDDGKQSGEEKGEKSPDDSDEGSSKQPTEEEGEEETESPLAAEDEDSDKDESAEGESKREAEEDDRTGKEDAEEAKSLESEDDEEEDPDSAEDDEEESPESGKDEEKPPESSTGYLPVFAAPSVRKLAREIGVDLTEVAGSGPGGRIVSEDVKRHARHNLKPDSGARRKAPPKEGPLPDFSQWGDVEISDLPGIRKKTAEHMGRSWATVPHVTLHAKADASQLERSVQRFRDRVEESTGSKLTLTAVLLKLTASALKAHPELAVSVDMEKGQLIRKQYCHLGVAVDTPKGLLVPVIRDVDQKSVSELASELQADAEKARQGKLPPAKMQGGVFTVTNLGGLGVGFFTPIVNYPEAGILGIGRLTTDPVWDETSESFEPGRLLPLSLSFDHRALDGADGARFLQWLVEAIEDPLLTLIDKQELG